ncbi:hypothetical protein HY629_01810 [Candidatus Uhrbacteria bacterium]|nr:hypothetical protein [Candidatus Uhrbacteria bacterium]
MFSASGKNLLLIGCLAVVLGIFVVWNTRNGGLWNKGEPKTEQAQAEQIQEDGKEAVKDTFTSKLPGVEYEFAPPSGANGEGAADAPSEVNMSAKAIPDLSRPIPVHVRPKERAEMERLSSELKNNLSNAALWLELGLYRKESGDYEGAQQAWEFGYKLQPENSVIADNLGVLYGYYLKNGLKSEEFFLAAIAREPHSIHLRLRLFELYRDVFQDKDKARASIEDALKDNPGSEQLTALLRELSL